MKGAVGVPRAAKGVGEFVIEAVGETAGEALLSRLTCALLAGLALIAYLSWSFSPRLTIAGAGLLSFYLAHGAWQTFRAPAKGRRRGLTALTTAGFALTALTPLFVLVYATGCNCP
ncbi:lysine transporter LysE [Streptomyces sp. NPDC051364]|uniref:lysine transporter LysE n=1 Tax=Streptomyces sp. NPDC051364 TaxID=3155799 RepID=UPI00342CF681